MNLPPNDPLRETRFASFFDKGFVAGDDFDDEDDELDEDEEDRLNDEN